MELTIKNFWKQAAWTIGMAAVAVVGNRIVDVGLEKRRRMHDRRRQELVMDRDLRASMDCSDATAKY